MTWSQDMYLVESEMNKIPDSSGIYELGVIDNNNNQFNALYLDYSDNSLRWAYYIHEQTKANNNHVVGQFLGDPSELKFRYLEVDKPREKCIEMVKDSGMYLKLSESEVESWKNCIKGVRKYHTNDITY